MRSRGKDAGSAGQGASWSRDPGRRAESRERLAASRLRKQQATERSQERDRARPGRSRGGAGRGRAIRTGSSGRRPRRPLTSPTRGQALRRRWIVVGSAALVVAAVVAVLFTPALGVHTVRVTGTHVLSAQRVRDAAGIEQGTPILRVDTAAVRDRVAGIPQVASVRVSRSLPFTVHIAVTERRPVAVFDSAEGVRLVDRTGLPYLTVPKPPPGLPRIDLPKISAKDPATHAVVTVLAALPDAFRARVASITASRQGDVRFALRDGKKVTWGTPEHSRRKAAVLKVLLTREGTVYDVTSPDLPAVS